jgi:hypothetical protein
MYPRRVWEAVRAVPSRAVAASVRAVQIEDEHEMVEASSEREPLVDRVGGAASQT